MAVAMAIRQESAAVLPTVVTVVVAVAAVAPAAHSILMLDHVAATARVARRLAGIRAVDLLLPSHRRIDQSCGGVGGRRRLHLGLHQHHVVGVVATRQERAETQLALIRLVLLLLGAVLVEQLGVFRRSDPAAAVLLRLLG